MTTLDTTDTIDARVRRIAELAIQDPQLFITAFFATGALLGLLSDEAMEIHAARLAVCQTERDVRLVNRAMYAEMLSQVELEIAKDLEALGSP